MNGRPVRPRSLTSVSAFAGGHAAAEGALHVGPADAGVRQRLAGRVGALRPAGHAGMAAEGVDADSDDRDVHGALRSTASLRARRRRSRPVAPEASRRSGMNVSLIGAPISSRAGSASVSRDSTSTAPLPSSVASSTYPTPYGLNGPSASYGRLRLERLDGPGPQPARGLPAAPSRRSVPVQRGQDRWLGKVVVPQAAQMLPIRRGRSGQLNRPSSTGTAVTSVAVILPLVSRVGWSPLDQHGAVRPAARTRPWSSWPAYSAGPAGQEA